MVMSGADGDGGGGWRVHRFVARSGSAALRVELVWCGSQLVVWAGGLAAAPALGGGALALGGAATALEPAADPRGAALCGRLAARLDCPVLLLAPELDRLAAPLLEAALCEEIARRPDLFPARFTDTATKGEQLKCKQN